MTAVKIWFLALVAALGGFLFGFDTIVINGAEQDIQALWSLSGRMHGIVVSSALWGTVVGALIGGWVSDRYGRRRTLQAVGALYFVSAVWSAFAGGPWELVIARLIGGFGVGISTIAAPIYIAEIAPSEHRGKMTALFQLNIVLGIVISLASNLLLNGIGANAWRWMLGMEALPAFGFLVLSFFLIESPRWKNGAVAAVSDGARFLCRANLWPIMIAFCVAFFNQLSGVNAINFYAVRVFKLAGLERNAAFMSTFGLGILKFSFTFTGVWLIDRLGRKTLLVIGGIGYVVSLFATAFFFANGNAVLSAACIFLFMAAHAVGQGTVIWVLVSEVFPQRFRAQGQSLGATTHWVFAALVSLVFPIAAERFSPSAIFSFFGVMMVLHLLWAVFVVRETKGTRLD